MAHRNRWFTVLKNGWISQPEVLAPISRGLGTEYRVDPVTAAKRATGPRRLGTLVASRSGLACAKIYGKPL